MKTILVVLALAAVAPTVRAANGVAPGQFVIEPATLICFGFEWDITGDDNRNATVEVSYRVSGQTAWIDGMPLLRMGGERIMRAPYTVPDRFAGSILDLQPDTIRRPSDDEGSRWRVGTGGPERQGPYAGRAEGRGRRPHDPRLSPDLAGLRRRIRTSRA